MLAGLLADGRLPRLGQERGDVGLVRGERGLRGARLGNGEELKEQEVREERAIQKERAIRVGGVGEQRGGEAKGRVDISFQKKMSFQKEMSI